MNEQSMTRANRLLELLYDAQRQPIGILVRTDEPQKLSRALSRAKLLDPILAKLSIRISPFPDGDLVIVHGVDDRDAEGVKAIEKPFIQI